MHGCMQGVYFAYMKQIVLLRIALALIFLWAFFDKLLGLGFATKPQQAWVQGGSPTYGFLTTAAHGPFADLFKSLAGVPLVDWLFMAGLLFVGLTLLLSRYVRAGATVGMVMLALMYLALIPPKNNPLIDDHIIYIIALSVVAKYTKPKQRGGV